MSLVHHPPPSLATYGPDRFAKKSRSTFSWPICWYSRATRAASLLAATLTVAKDPRGSLNQGLLPGLDLPGVDFILGGQLGYRLLPLYRLQSYLGLERRAVFPPFFGRLPLLLINSDRCL